ncbi:MAG: ISKra4 family transposase, partial [Moorea sp. SIO3H5]|nr:ISKra4 family transposase [Moorena sp. SIO3H5]
MVLTRMSVSHSTQQRLVHRLYFELPELYQTVEEMGVDGGKVRLPTAFGERSQWRDYIAVTFPKHCVGAVFCVHDSLVSWVNHHTVATPVICLGDGQKLPLE